MARLLPGAERDGTSQAGRALVALSPDYVAVDERTAEDLLGFARAYGKELTYYGADGQPAGDWSGLVAAKLRPEQVAAFVREPEKCDPQTLPELFRPHFVLLLTFLQLLDKTRAEMNTLTGRHLDFYYRQILRLARKRSIPDRVNLVVDLAPDSSEVLLPQGTLLAAGPDSLGRDRSYATARDLVVNRTQLAQVSSLFVDRRRTALPQVVTRYKNDKARACEAMFAIALTDPLVNYPDGTAVNFAKLQQLRVLLKRASGDFFLSLSELRDLMVRKQLRPAPPAEWTEIRAKLELAGTKKRGGVAFHTSGTSLDFDRNLAEAVGPFNLGTLPEVNRVDDLYDRRSRSDVAAFIHNQLYFDNLDDFARMMQLKRKFFTEWGEINRLLEVAGQRKRSDPAYRLVPVDVTAFADNVQAAVGRNDLERYWGDVQTLESYFFMPAESYAAVLDEVLGSEQAVWQQCFDILEDAHKEKLRFDRRAQLAQLRAVTPPARLVDLIRFVLGEPADPADDSAALDRLAPFLGKPDLDKLQPLVSASSQAAATDKDWAGVYRVLEVAQRNRLGEPPAERQEWLNLYPAADAVALGLRGAADTDSPRWATFGVARPAPTPSPAPAPVLGWAVSSPLLSLREGKRVITLSLGFRPQAASLARLFPGDANRPGFPDQDACPLLFEVSTAQGWVRCLPVAVKLDSYRALAPTSCRDTLQGLQVVLSVDPGCDPIAALPDESAALPSPWPTLRVMLRPLWNPLEKQHVARYPELGQLVMVAAHLKVEVSGLKALQLQNDERTLDYKKPFEPFGSAPAVGSRLLLGHPELVGKKLDSLTFRLQWMGAPTQMVGYYANYGLPTTTQFTARVSLIDRSGPQDLLTAAPLFSSVKNPKYDASPGTEPAWLQDGSAEAVLRITSFPAAAQVATPAALAAPALSEDLADWDRFVQWELNTDFQHENYPIVAANQALALAGDLANKATIVAANYQVRPPYTPKLKSLTVEYSASREIRFEDGTRDADTDRVLHIHPFGACDVEAERTPTGLPFLPRYADDGELYLGLSGLSAPQTVALFFQLAEGSANPDLQPQPIVWSYLSGDRWLPLDRNVLSDTTRGLINSGIVELALLPAAPSTRIRGDLYYVRATVARDTASLCDTIGIHTQAVAATFVDQDNAPEHFREPLPAATITNLATPVAEIAGVRQPYTSYGGRMAEGDDTWATRVSERLRHKQRALSMWDYERLVLEGFPEIYKAKCVPAQAGVPGQVAVIVIPDIRNKLPFDPFEPKAPSNLLAEVQRYLAVRAPAFATIAVQNAHYVSVRVRLGVRFRVEGNEGYYKQKLSEELNRFLSPWAYDEGADLAIGARIYASSIVDFVDRRPYVDYVAGIKLFSSDDGEIFRPVAPPTAADPEGYFVGASRPDAVLVAARTHQIDVLADGLYEEKLVTGIDFMKLELDFIVAEG